MDYYWDNKKAKLNVAKHGVTFQTAAKVFDDLRRTEAYDSEHSVEEERRYLTIGLTGQGLITVVYTCRGEIIRIISARKATVTEEKEYLGRSYL